MPVVLVIGVALALLYVLGRRNSDIVIPSNEPLLVPSTLVFDR